MGQNITAWKVSLSFHIHSKCGKIRTRKTPNTDTFQAVCLSNICQILKNLSIPNFMNLSKPSALKYRSSHWNCLIKKGVLKISQSLQESTYTGVSFIIKLQVSSPQLYWKRDLTQVFSFEFWRNLKTPFLQNTSRCHTSSYLLEEIFVFAYFI